MDNTTTISASNAIEEPATISLAKPFDKTSVLILHALYAAALITGGLGALAGVIFAYVKRSKDQSEEEQSHYKHAIRTFWWSVGVISLTMVMYMAAIGLAFSGIASGFFGGSILVNGLMFLTSVGLFVWYVIRVIKGFARATDMKGMY